MIQLTRLNHVPLIVNSDLIEQVEVTPDTVVTLTTGQKLLVLETADDVVERVILFRRAILGENACPMRVNGARGGSAQNQRENSSGDKA
jgi:flagellar protein FlbD